MKQKYSRLVKRRGKKKALVAIGHDIIKASYFIIRDNVTYQPIKPISEEQIKRKQANYYLKKLKEVGIEVQYAQAQN